MPGLAEVNGAHVELRPTYYLSEPEEDDENESAALIILHSPIGQYEYIRRLYHHSSFRLCADGGANRLHDVLTRQFSSLKAIDALKKAPPNCIHGDLDSLDSNVRKLYEQMGVKVSKDPDQYSTDLAKAVKKVTTERPDVRDILVLGSLGGRVDHGIGLLSELFKEHKYNNPGIRFWLFSESSVSVLLRPGSTTIHTPLKSGLITQNIGVLPVYGRAVLTLQGMEWDVEDWPTEMGGQISTSNHIAADCITVVTDNDVLLTIERVVDLEKNDVD